MVASLRSSCPRITWQILAWLREDRPAVYGDVSTRMREALATGLELAEIDLMNLVNRRPTKLRLTQIPDRLRPRSPATAQTEECSVRRRHSL